MCIRDRLGVEGVHLLADGGDARPPQLRDLCVARALHQPAADVALRLGEALQLWLVDRVACLLYTSDAADERSSVDLGGRRLQKKKTQEQYETAEKWYLLALEKEPKNIAVRTDLGLTFFLRTPRDVNRAIKEYNVSLGIDPNNEITLQNLVLAYRENGDKENLRVTLEKLKKINPNNPAISRVENAL